MGYNVDKKDRNICSLDRGTCSDQCGLGVFTGCMSIGKCNFKSKLTNIVQKKKTKKKSSVTKANKAMRNSGMPFKNVYLVEFGGDLQNICL